MRSGNQEPTREELSRGLPEFSPRLLKETPAAPRCHQLVLPLQADRPDARAGETAGGRYSKGEDFAVAGLR